MATIRVAGSAAFMVCHLVVLGLAEGTYLLTPRQWLATTPSLNEQENNPSG